MRKAYSWVRAVIAVGLIGVSGWTLYQNYIADDESDVSAETTTTAPAELGGDTTELALRITGPVPSDRFTVIVAGSAAGDPSGRLTDGDPETTWVCSPCASAEAPGIGEAITFDLADTVAIESIQISNGFPAENGFFSNNRIQRLQIDLGSGPQETTLPDSPELVTIEITGSTARVSLSVLSIYQATEGAGAFGVSEITLVGSYVP